ncbi:hypothetical protein L1887_29628 [Cichorium endivia]|nr:hypothetical protein L1887_29628 [Cichorium endivia]
MASSTPMVHLWVALNVKDCFWSVIAEISIFFLLNLQPWLLILVAILDIHRICRLSSLTLRVHIHECCWKIGNLYLTIRL